jgi:hypothetical protein
MFKRPSQRVRPGPPKRVEGPFLYDIITKKPTEIFKFEKGPVYQKELYLRLLKKNYEDMNVPYVEPVLPTPTPRPNVKRIEEPELVYGDRIQVTLRILKTGLVRVKVNGSIATMYEKYYRHGLQPPIKTVLQAYKAHGFSKEFLEKVKRTHDRKITYAKKVPGILEKIFDKQVAKKIKKDKEEKKRREEEDEFVEEEEEEDVVPDEEGAMDVEPDEEEEVVDEEEYVSDGDT